MQEPSSLADISACLLNVRERLAEQDDQGVNDALSHLDASGSPQSIMEQLAPHLFRLNKSNEEIFMSNQESLSILSLLVSHDPSKFLQPASLAVRKEAVRMGLAADELMIVSPELLSVMINQLSSDLTGVSSQADETLVACCRKLGVERLGNAALQMLVQAWRGAWNGVDQNGSNNSKLNETEASTICVRCASCIADIATMGDDFMRAAAANGALTIILQMLGDEDDVLLAMASLDIIEKMVTTRPMHDERAHWLYSKAVLLPLLEMAGSEAEPDPVLGGPALRVLSQLCKLGHSDSNLFSQAGDFLLKGFHQALHNFDVSNELDRLAKIDAISSFASGSPDALQIVLDDAVTRRDWLSLSVAQSKLKAVVLHSIAMVLDPAIEVDANGDTITSANITTARIADDDSGRRLYFTFGQVNSEEPTKLILTLARSPLPELRLGAYALFTAVAKLAQGPQILLSDAHFLEFLLSRPSHETIKEGREAKYQLVQTIYDSSAKGLLADKIVQQIDKYLRQGPHFIETETWEVATEG
ncbi:hypothetical protein MPSEU_000206300 [Mayamaea pseudoterrestris]|nr:hypothetical protein MPSEU_000206300 [Mayamaea pseudoterrestris]